MDQETQLILQYEEMIRSNDAKLGTCDQVTERCIATREDHKYLYELFCPIHRVNEYAFALGEIVPFSRMTARHKRMIRFSAKSLLI
jgi:hypothetical protein